MSLENPPSRGCRHGAGASTQRVADRRSLRNAKKLGPLALRPGRFFRYLRDPSAPLLPKLMMVLSVIYVLVPTDLVPDLIPIVGWLDDAGLVTIALGWLWASLARHEAKMASAGAQLEVDPASGPELGSKAAVTLDPAETLPDRPRPRE